jgi:hypothetical protein
MGQRQETAATVVEPWYAIAMKIAKPLVPVGIARPNPQNARERGVAAFAIKNSINPCTECPPKVPGAKVLVFVWLSGK